VLDVNASGAVPPGLAGLPSVGAAAERANTTGVNTLGADEFGPGSATLTALAPVGGVVLAPVSIGATGAVSLALPTPKLPLGPNIRIWGAPPAAKRLLGVTTAAIAGVATLASWGAGLAQAVASWPVCPAVPAPANTPAANTAVIMVVCLAIMIARTFPSRQRALGPQPLITPDG
jgi:hypothetical protein